MDAAGKEQKGKINAANEDAARTELKAKKLYVTSLRAQVETKKVKSGKKKGVRQRLFRCTPLHHHYTITDDKLDSSCKYMFKGPKKPMHEAKVTARFWIVTIIMAAITLMTLKIR